MIRQLIKKAVGTAAREVIGRISNRRGAGQGEDAYGSSQARGARADADRGHSHDDHGHDHGHSHSQDKGGGHGHEHGDAKSHDHGHSHSHDHGHSHGQDNAKAAPVAASAAGPSGIQIGKKPSSQPSRESLPRRTGDVDSYLKETLAANPVLLFVKGVPGAPACGFSARVMDIFNQTGAAYKTFNVLEDYEVREGIKKMTQWPTIPQIFIKGEFIGGADIVAEMYANGDLQAKLKEVAGG